MRITNGMLINNMMNNLNNNLNRMERYQNQGASGRKFDKPSDDPIGMSRSLKLYTDISKVEQYERNLNDASSWMHTTEEALKEVEKIIQRTRELSAEAANGTKTESDTKNIAEEIKQLKEQMIKIGNTRHAGRSVFTGFKTDKDLFRPDGSYNIDIKRDDVSIYNVGISEDIEINIVGTRVFGVMSKKDILGSNLKGYAADETKDSDETKNRKSDNLHTIKNKLKEALNKTPTPTITDSSTTPPTVISLANIDSAITSYANLPTDTTEIGSIKTALNITGGDNEPDELWLNMMHNYGRVDQDVTIGFESDGSNERDNSSIMQMFDKLTTAMEKGDYEQISNYLGDIDKVHQNIISIKAEIGAKTNRLDMTEQRLSAEKLNFKTNLSKNEDVDYGELVMQSKLAETVYNVSLAISSKVIQPTLMDFLR